MKTTRTPRSISAPMTVEAPSTAISDDPFALAEQALAAVGIGFVVVADTIRPLHEAA